MTSDPLPTPREFATTRPTSLLALAVAWTLVGLPLAWGVYQTVLGAMTLFHS